MRIRTDEGVRDLRAVWQEGGQVKMIDQRCLPHDLVIRRMSDHREIAGAISDMTVRGAPSIGAAAAYGMMLASMNNEDIDKAALLLRSTRPTANDLFFAVDTMMQRLEDGHDPVDAADSYADSIVARCHAIGVHGARLIRGEENIMTHCNAGALASVDFGTALAPMRIAWEEGRSFFVYVSETRPRLQGMKLTAWELLNEGIPHTVIVDSASAYFMSTEIDMIITGADRITASGDFANKVGTLEKAIIAHEYGIPFYVAAPISTFDLSIESGDDILIERRAGEEITEFGDIRIAPEGSGAINPAFDVTPARLVTGIITEKGILAPGEISGLRGGDLDF